MMWFMFECFCHKIKLGVKSSTKFWIQCRRSSKFNPKSIKNSSLTGNQTCEILDEDQFPNVKPNPHIMNKLNKWNRASIDIHTTVTGQSVSKSPGSNITKANLDILSGSSNKHVRRWQIGHCSPMNLSRHFEIHHHLHNSSVNF